MRSAHVAFSAAALRDAQRIADRLERDAGIGIARRFAATLERRSLQLRTTPLMGRLTSRRDTYVVLLPRFPYHLIYEQTDDETCTVLRIRHAHRRPLSWL